MPNSVSIGFGTAMITGSSRRFKRYPTTYMWVSSWLSFTVDKGLSWFILILSKGNRLDEPIFIAVAKPMLTEFGIHYRLESCGVDWILKNRFSVMAIPVCVYAVTRNKDTTKVLYCGWTPVIIAMSISRCDLINSFHPSHTDGRRRITNIWGLLL